jgi:hypothetical protein
MKKGKILIVGLIVLLMAGGLVLMGCEEPCAIKEGGCSVSVSDSGISSLTACGQSSCKVVKEAKEGKASSSCDCKK